MRSFILVFGILAMQSASTQAQDAKPIFILPITNYIVGNNDSIKVVQVFLPDGYKIEDGEVALLKHNAKNSSDDSTVIGNGKCRLIKGNYHYFSIRLKDKKDLPQGDDLLYTYLDYKADYKGRIFNLVRKAVYLTKVTGENIYEFPTPASLTAKTDDALIDSMVADIQYTGKQMQQQNDAQDQVIKDGFFDGKKLFDVMATVSADNVKDFIDFVLARPAKYSGNSWKIAEVFATWAVSGYSSPDDKGMMKYL